MGRGWKCFEGDARQSPGCLEETLGRNLGIKSASGKASKQREGSPCYKVEKNLAELCSKAEHVSDEFRYLAEKISKQSVEGVAWFLIADSKM